MKTPKTSRKRRVIVIAALLTAATTIVTVGMAVVVPASSIVKPVYAELDISEQIGGEEEIPELDDISEKVGEITTSQSLPTLPEQASLTPIFRSPPAFAG
jgi:hypothetical protein